MTAAYVPAGELLEPAVVPRTCLYAAAAERACDLTVHHIRERKTGPRVPVTVLQCRTHHRAFTIYPLGHVPYGRLAVAPVGPDGALLYAPADQGRADGRQGPAWGSTIFGPAFEAAEQTAPAPDRSKWWATEQAERLAMGAAVVGVHPGLPAAVGEAVAVRLEIPRLFLLTAAAQYQVARGRAARARVLVGVLGQLPASGCLVDRLLAAGAIAGCWGTGTRWDPASGGARGRVFPGRGAPAG